MCSGWVLLIPTDRKLVLIVTVLLLATLGYFVATQNRGNQSAPAPVSPVIETAGSDKLRRPPMQCDVSGIGEELRVLVSVLAPHPTEMILERPDGLIIWLRLPDMPHKFPVSDDFGNLESFVIDNASRGTVYRDGQFDLSPLLIGKGFYHLIIAQNVETELDNTYFVDCRFVIN